jgi:hypothetical protein
MLLMDDVKSGSVPIAIKTAVKTGLLTIEAIHESSPGVELLFPDLVKARDNPNLSKSTARSIDYMNR